MADQNQLIKRQQIDSSDLSVGNAKSMFEQ